MKDIGAELDAIADCPECRRPFEHTHRLTVTCERKRSGEPTESAADDEDGVLRAQIVLKFASSQWPIAEQSAAQSKWIIVLFAALRNV
jgi:hypothetical protein